MTIKFKYFSNPLKYAEFTDVKCQSCGTTQNCLEGEYFDRGDDVVSVCLNCLNQGVIVVDLPEYIKDRIHQDKTEKLTRLERTPPVPWIQYNDWPVCCDDFMCYIGEWEQKEFDENSENGNGKEYLISLLDENIKNRVDDINVLWDDLGEYTALFVFECIHCKRKKGIPQSY
jgi:uncharacterized protein CbrC (UPF0167 family)